MTKVITRRDFMVGTAAAATGLALGLSPAPEKKTRVVLIRHADAIDKNGQFNAKIVQQMLDEAMMALTGQKEPVLAWKQLVKPDETVGVKTNVYRSIPTPAELEQAIRTRLLEAGISEKKLDFDDRGVLRNPIFQNATSLINVRPVRTHYWSGIGGCLKNYIMFSPNPPQYHPDSCADLALLWYLPIVKGKTRLNILAAFRPLFHSRGPHNFDQRYLWNYNGLIVSTDPVAVDAVGLELIRAKRRAFFGEDQALETAPKHIQVADERHKLGCADLQKMELIKLGWKEGILI